MKKLSHNDGSWANLLQEWTEQCHGFSEDFSAYAPAAIQVLEQQVELTEREKWNGVFALEDADGATVAICFLNAAFIKGFTGRVLRVRHVLLSPRSDFGEYDEAWYSETLGRLFEEILVVSDNIMQCNHVKIHFGSPADLALFSRMKPTLVASAHFASVNMHGAWLSLTKS